MLFLHCFYSDPSSWRNLRRIFNSVQRDFPGPAPSGTYCLREIEMPLNIRRVVTGHDEQGRAIVAIDELCRNVISRRPNHASCVIWSTGEFPADNSDAMDGATREVATTDPGGTVFRVI